MSFFENMVSGFSYGMGHQSPTFDALEMAGLIPGDGDIGVPDFYNPEAYDRARQEEALSGSSASGSAPATPQQIQYFDAPMAEKYGMSAATAYQEALANTAYQRKVADLKAAGLNPVLGISGSGAGGVYSASSGSGQSVGSFGSGKGSSSESDFSFLPYLMSGVGAIAGLVIAPGASKVSGAKLGSDVGYKLGTAIEKIAD